MKLRNPVFAAAVATTLGLTLASAAQAASARTARAPLPTSGSVAVGVVTRDGAPVGGAHLNLLAWPDKTVLAAAADGARIPLLPVSSVTTDSQGGFDLSVDWSKVPATYKDKHGAVNFDLAASDSSNAVSWSLSAANATPSNVQRLQTAAIASSGIGQPTHVDTLRIDLGTDPGVSSAIASRTTVIGASSTRLTKDGLVSVPKVKVPSPALVQAMSSGLPPSCYAVAGAWTYNVSERYAAVYAWGGAYGTMVQTNGSTHSIGVAYTVGGGKWTQNGTASFDESTGAGASRGGIANAWVYNSLNFRKFGNTCPPYGTKNMPVSTYGLLTNFTYAPPVKWSECNDYTGGEYWKTRGTNSTVGAGINLGPISVTAQSGWNSETSIRWNVTRKTRLCGSTHEGWAKSPQAEAHAG